MHLTHNKGKSVVTEKFIRTLNNRIYKYVTSISKNVYADKLDVMDNKYKNIYYRTIKMKLANVKPSMYIDFNEENKRESPKFEVCHHLKASKYKYIFAKGHVSN